MALDPLIERVQRTGFESATITDLMALAFAGSEAELADAETRGRELLRELGKIQGLAEMSVDHIRSKSGFSTFEVFQALAWFELGRRSSIAGRGAVNPVSNPKEVWEELSHLRNERREHFVVMLLDAKNVPIRTTTLHIGTLTMSVVGAREVFREAVREGASGIIVAHNHPSGDPSPSPEDIQVTHKLQEVGKLLDIVVHDHVILGHRDFCSLRKMGLMNRG